MTHRPDAEWWRSAVIYQVYPRSFADTNGDGIGDLAGVRSHIGHLERLGVDAVWLSPFYPSPMDDNGYDISDYCAVDPLYGDLGDLQALIADLHAVGIKFVVDLVVNHTSDEHPWFQDALRGGPKRDWYIWRPPRPGHQFGAPGAEPNNWGSFFSGSAWEPHPPSGEYYLHLFSPKQPDLNWENPAVREAVHDVMRWWLDRGADGFRMDVINLISKDPELPDGHIPVGMSFGKLGRAVVDGPRVWDHIAELRRKVLGNRRDLLLLGETPASSLTEARRYAHPDSRLLDMVISFDHMQIDRGVTKWDVLPFEMRKLRTALALWQDTLHPGWNFLYWNNHDQPRVVSRFGDDRRFWRESAKALATVLHLMRGTPIVYQGEELGMTNYPFRSVGDFDDVESLNHYAEEIATGGTAASAMSALRAMSRDNARTPMQWDESPNAGFTSGVPWRPVHPNHRDINASREYDDPGSIFQWYRSLIELRHSEPAVVHGSFELLAEDSDDVFAYVRDHGPVSLVVAVNFADHPVAVPEDVCRRAVGGEVVLCDREPRDQSLGPWESRVYRSRVSTWSA
jgi:oligo-1,6-glucosidase